MKQEDIDKGKFRKSINMELTQEQRFAFDIYAAAALQALISKLPIIDREGVHSAAASQEDINMVKRDIARSALDYAGFMMLNRDEFLNELKGHSADISLPEDDN